MLLKQSIALNRYKYKRSQLPFIKASKVICLSSMSHSGFLSHVQPGVSSKPANNNTQSLSITNSASKCCKSRKS